MKNTIKVSVGLLVALAILAVIAIYGNDTAASAEDEAYVDPVCLDNVLAVPVLWDNPHDTEVYIETSVDSELRHGIVLPPGAPIETIPLDTPSTEGGVLTMSISPNVTEEFEPYTETYRFGPGSCEPDATTTTTEPPQLIPPLCVERGANGEPIEVPCGEPEVVLGTPQTIERELPHEIAVPKPISFTG